MSPSTLRIRTLYFMLFLFLGGQGSYFSLWLEGAGWSGVELGWLGAVRSACLMVAPLFWGRLADRDGHAGRVLLWTTFGSLVAFLPALATADVGLLLASTVVFHAFREGVMPAADTATLRLVRREGGTFGRHRLWGSAGFVAGGFLLAGLIAAFGRDATPWVLTGLLYATIPIVRAVARAERAGTETAGAPPSLREVLGQVLRRDILWIFLTIFIWRVAMSGYFQFLPLHLGRIGVPDGAVSAYWSVGVVAEILLFTRAVPLFGRFEARHVLGLCLVACVVQCGLSAIVDDPWLFLALMTLHGLTFGIAFFTVVIWLGVLVPRSALATIQAVLYAFGFGVGGAASSAGAGYLFEQHGGPGLFGAAAALSLLAVLVAAVTLKDRTRFGTAAAGR